MAEQFEHTVAKIRRNGALNLVEAIEDMASAYGVTQQVVLEWLLEEGRSPGRVITSPAYRLWILPLWSTYREQVEPKVCFACDQEV